MKVSKKISDKLRLLPANPGVYLMKNRENKIIYIGKAKVLKNRVRSYFTGKPSDEKTAQLVSNIYDFDYIIVGSEYEALITEANLIKKHKPRYNILLKDNRQYPFIKITKEAFPRVFVTRELKKDGAKYFGPYTEARSVRSTIRTLEWLFPVRNCARDIPEGSILYDRPCINYQIGKCTAPCVGYISKEEYNKSIHHIVRFLKGKNTELISIFENEMQDFSEKMEFEKAAKSRDKMQMLQKVQNSQSMYFTDERNRDVIGIYQDGDISAVSVLKILGGRLLNKEIYEMKFSDKETNSSILSAFLVQYYSERLKNLPYRIMINETPENLDEIESFLDKKIVIPKRGENRRIIGVAIENAFNYVENQKLKHMRKSSRTILPIQELKDRLNLRNLPRKMVCFDISTIQGTDTVSSGVFFENGKPKKKNYRKFIMKTVIGQDDFASMRETLLRYLKNIKDGEFDKPDLMVIDGGKGQLSASYAILKEEGMESIEMISLAKRLEEVFKPGESESTLLPRSSGALRILVHIRDEAHRTAVSFHRKRRSARTLTSELDEIKGLGQKMKFTLLKEFGSVAGVKKASIDDLLEIKGVGKSLAEKIVNGLKEDKE